MLRAVAALAIRARAVKELMLGEPELATLGSLVPAQTVAVDVGAHKGVYTYWLSRICSHVHAIEPVPSLADLVEAAELKNVSMHRWAASSKVGRATLYLPRRDGRLVLSRSSLLVDANVGYNLEESSVETRPIDALHLKDVGFIKIDVEGNELDALKGAELTVEQSRPTLLIESELRHGTGPHAIHEYLAGRNYEGLFISDGEILPFERFSDAVHQGPPLRRTGRTPGYINNFIFVHASKLDRVSRLLRR